MVSAWRATDKASIISNGKAAASAFDELFAGAARVTRHLPEPFKFFSDVLGSFNNFFARNRALLLVGFTSIEKTNWFNEMSSAEEIAARTN